MNIQAGQPWAARGLQLRPRVSEVNTYATSAFLAQLYTDPGTGLETVTQIPLLSPAPGAGRHLYVIVLGQDVPIIAEVIFELVVGGAASIPMQHVNTIVMGVPATTAEYGAPTSLDLGLSSLVTGFAVAVDLDQGPYTMPAGAVVPFPGVRVLTNAGAVEGPSVSGTDLAPTNVTHIPIVLNVADYTEAMLEANNVIEQAGVTYQIVALYNLNVV